MKKTLLLSAFAFIAILGLNAQTVWNFSNAPFGAVGAAGGTAVIPLTANYTTPDGLTLGTDGTVLWTGLTASAKTIGTTSYTYRLQTGGGGANVLPSYLPVTRYLKFNVSGPSTFSIGMLSSSSTATRTLIVVNADQSVVDSIVNISGTTAAAYTYNYTGAASTIYLYSRASGLNYYFLSATNVVTTTSAVAEVLSDKGVSFNGTEILNTKGLSLEVYSVLGKKVATSMTNIPTANFQKGVYIVRVSGLSGSLKICI